MRVEFTASGRCNCGLPRSWANQAQHPVMYDAATAEYRFRNIGGTLHYCPFCGGKLPEISRSEWFIVIDETEADAALALGERLHNLADVSRLLGEPDEIGQSDNDSSTEQRRWSSLWCYTRRWDTIDLLVYAYPEGDLHLTTRPKGRGELFP